MPPRVTPRFITLEGGDGCGKSTQAAALARWLRRRGYAVWVTREPGGTRLGEQVRRLLMGSRRLTPWTELLLFQAARAQHVAEVIRPRLRRAAAPAARGTVVLCDRFADSTMAYQGYGLGLDRGLVAAITRAATGGLTPDLTVILDAPAAAGLRRARRRQRMERRGVGFQRRVRAGFRVIARREAGRCRLIRVQPTPAATQALIQSVVTRALARRHRA